MKRPGPCVLAMVLTAVAARGDLTVVQKVEGAGSVNQLTIKIKGDKARIEASPEMTTLIDSRTGDMINLINAEKRFVRISADKAKAMAEMVSKYGGAPDPAGKPALVPSGRKETIHGQEAAEYVSAAAASKASYWIALNYPDGPAILKQLQAVTPEAWRDATKGMLDYRDLPGIPLRAHITMRGIEMTTTILSIKQDPLNDAEFSPGKDFQEIKIPAVQAAGETPAPAPKP